MIYDRIKALCKSNDTNIKQLEIAVGIANGSVARWKTSKPSSDSIKKIAEYFNVSTDFLLGNDDGMSKNVPNLDFFKQNGKFAEEKDELFSFFVRLKKSNRQKVIAYTKGLLDAEIDQI